MTSNKHSKRLIVIVGPTGSGKTDLSIEVARHFGCPILSTDSRQFYRGVAIGTAQPSAEQLAAVRHYFVANRDVSDDYACGKYEQDAVALLDELFVEYDNVVAVGGSGLYIDALCGGLDSIPDVAPQIRIAIDEQFEQQGLEPLLEELQRLDPQFYETVDRSNPKRVKRALEVCRQTGEPYSQLRRGETKPRNFDTIKIGVTMDRAALYERINRRVDIMVESGLEAEARAMLPNREYNSLQTVGYREFFDYFDGVVSREEAIELIKRNSRRYAKRQLTWFNRDKSTLWFHPSEVDKVLSQLS